MDRWCEAVILVTAEPQIQIERLKSRSGLSEAEARARLASQLPQENTRARTEYIIDNSGHILQTETRLKEVLREILP